MRHLMELGALFAAGCTLVAPIVGKADEASDSSLRRGILDRQAGVALTASSGTAEHRAWTDKLQRERRTGAVTSDPFSSKSWALPHKVPTVATPAAPTAPPFPFRFIGKMLRENATPNVFLTRNDQLYTVSTGDVLDSVYRVDSIQETEFEVTYLPLGRRQRFPYAELAEYVVSAETRAEPASSAPANIIYGDRAVPAAPDSGHKSASGPKVVNTELAGMTALVRAVQGAPGNGGGGVPLPPPDRRVEPMPLPSNYTQHTAPVSTPPPVGR